MRFPCPVRPDLLTKWMFHVMIEWYNGSTVRLLGRYGLGYVRHAKIGNGALPIP